MKSYQFPQLSYIPTDFDAVRSQLTQLTQQAKSAPDAEALLACLTAYDALMEDVQYAYTLCYIRSSLDCTDAHYQAALEHEGVGQAMLDTAPFLSALLHSPFLPQLERQFGSQFRPMLMQRVSTQTAGHELMAREQVLLSEYQQKKAALRISFRGEMRSENEMYPFFDDPDRQTRIDARRALAKAVLEQKDAFAPMLLELISVRDAYAKENGFANYLEYANTVYGRLDYGEAEMTAFCQQVKDELVPLLCDLQEEQRRRLRVEKLMAYDNSILFADGNARPVGDADCLTRQSMHIYDALSPDLGRFFRSMVDTQSLHVAASPHKVAGMGFCTDLKTGLYPYVFGNCNGTETDVSTFTHEIGHAYQDFLTSQRIPLSLLRHMPLDACEIPSKTMELFTYPYAESFFGKDAEKFRQGHFRNALREIASYCAIHELNAWIYTHVGASFEALTAKEQEIALLYNPALDYGELSAYHAQGADLMRNMAVYMFPRYVISYALSEMCAMDLFRLMQTQPRDAWRAYETLCACGGSLSYPNILKQAGLEPAYAHGRIRKVAAFARDHLGL